MSVLKRGISIILVLLMILGLAACAGGDGPDSSSEDASSYREPYVADVAPQEEEWVDTDGDFEYKTVEWAGPAGYNIVFPAGNEELKVVAEYLQDYYTRVHDVTLKIVTDASAATDKEILIGKTNRKESKADLKEGELSASLQGNKLVFIGGHDVTSEAAVKRFTRLFPDKNEAFTFSLETDFTTVPDVEGLENYKYVWGDEFEDWYDIDYGKWTFRSGMSGSKSAKISTDRDVIEVSDGRLKIRSINYFNHNEPEVLFKMPWSTATYQTFNFLYGYAEIRARIPFFKGAWPSFWGGSATQIVPRNPLWHAEVDVFEIFGSEDTVVPNIHKWYKSSYNYWTENGLEHQEKNHTQWGSKTTWLWGKHGADLDNLDNEYHVYGYEWTPTEVSMWVEGEKYMTFDITTSYDKNDNMDAFRDPIFLMFNMHVFADDADYQPNLINDNIECLPAHYGIDYYRVYQKKDKASRIWVEYGKGRLDPDMYVGRDDPWKPEE